MDNAVQAIFKIAIAETATPHDAHQALIRAGEIAKAYSYSDGGLVESVFASTNSSLGNHNDSDSLLASDARH